MTEIAGVRINYVMEFGNFGFKDELTGAGWSDGWKKAQQKGAAEAEKIFYEWHQYDPGVVPNLLQHRRRLADRHRRV